MPAAASRAAHASAALMPMVEVSITVLTLRSGAAASSRATASDTFPSGSERMMVAARAATSALLLAMPAPGGAFSVLTASATTRP